MKLSNVDPIVYFSDEVIKKLYSECEAPLTPKEGISEEEKNENVDYSESKVYILKKKFDLKNIINKDRTLLIRLLRKFYTNIDGK